MSRSLLFESEIGCSVESLYAFHADTVNLPKITPPGISVQIEALPSRLEAGAEATLFIRRGLLGFRWKVRFEKVEPPHCIVDTALKSPFATFRHVHRFTALGEARSLLSDEVTFELPMGWLGCIAEPFVASDMEKMFAFRHAQTRRMLE
ncbi:MAG TPA: hypothetical protein ENL04_02755 [Sulfuricurvum sp.]|nr:hypothetical protein [Sulfuricurvum sp.]